MAESGLKQLAPGDSQMTANTDDKRDFFISFNKADRAWATWLAWTLEAVGYTVLFQDWDFVGNFVLKMNEGLKRSRRMIAILSPDYLTSVFAAPEWAAVFRQDPTSEHDLLVPVRVRECEPEGLLAQIVYLDLTGRTRDQARDLLLKRVSGERPKPGEEPPFPIPSAPLPTTVRTVKREPSFPLSDELFQHPPRPPWGPYGRDDEIRDAVRVLTRKASQPIVVLGGPGLGKSTVLRAILHHRGVIKKYGAARRFLINCDQAPNAEALLRRLAMAVGAEPVNAQTLLGIMAALRRAPAILALDGLQTTWQDNRREIDEILASLATLPKLALLMAFQGNQPPGEVNWYRVHLNPLKIEPAKKLFLKIAPEHKSRSGQLNAILRDLDGLPLAIVLMAHAALGAPDLDGVTKRWRDERSAMLERYPGAEHDPSTSVRAAVEVALEALGTEKKATEPLLCLLTLMPIGLLRTELDALISLGGQKAAFFLRRAGLAVDEGLRLRMLGPIRLCVQDTTTIKQEAKDKALEWVVSHYEDRLSHLALALGDGDNAAVASEGPNLAYILNRGLQRISVVSRETGLVLVREANAFANYLFLFGLYKLAEKYLQDARDAAIFLGDENGRKLTSLNRGRIAEKLGKYPDAEDALREAGAGEPRVEEDFIRLAAVSYIRGIIDFNRTQYPNAKRVLKDGFRYLKRINDESAFARERDYICCDLHERFCVVANAEENYPRAAEHGNCGLKIAESLKDDYRIAVHLKNLAWSALRQRDFGLAREHGERGLRHARYMDRDASSERSFRGEIPGLHGLLAEVYDHLGEPELAERSAKEGWRSAVRAHHSWHKAFTAIEWGEVRLRRGDSSFAGRAFGKARRIAEAINSPDMRARAEFGLARVAHASGKPQSDVLQHARLSLGLLRKHRLRREAKEVADWLSEVGLAVNARTRTVRVGAKADA